MKPPPFAYHAPASVSDALATLAEVGTDGKVLAGGQSLIPLLNMRLAAPAHLVDITRIPELRQVSVDEAGVTVGAAVRQADVERDGAAHEACPLLRQALRLVAHPVIRNRGTVCGSLAHADPASELPAALALLGGTVRVEAAGRDPRDVPAAAFFLGPLEPALEPGELVTAAAFPRLPATAGTAFVEVARRHGDYALCGVAARVDVDADGRVAAARVATVSVAPTPLVLDVDGVGARADQTD